MAHFEASVYHFDSGFKIGSQPLLLHLHLTSIKRVTPFPQSVRFLAALSIAATIATVAFNTLL